MALVPHGAALWLRRGYLSVQDTWADAKRLAKPARRDLPHLLYLTSGWPGDVQVRPHLLTAPIEYPALVAELFERGLQLPTHGDVALLLKDGRAHQRVREPTPIEGAVDRRRTVVVGTSRRALYALYLGTRLGIARYLVPLSETAEEWDYAEIRDPPADAGMPMVAHRVGPHGRFQVVIPSIVAESRAPCWMRMTCRTRRGRPIGTSRATAQLPLFSPP